MSDHGRGGNPYPNQEPILRAQLHRRDAQIDRQAEACEIGKALKSLNEVRARQESRRKAREGVPPHLLR